MKNMPLFNAIVIFVILAGAGICYHLYTVHQHGAEIEAWQQAVLPVYSSRTNAFMDPQSITPAGVKNMLNPCHAVSYQEMGKWSQRGCSSFAEPIAPIVVTARFDDPWWEEPIERGP